MMVVCPADISFCPSNDLSKADISGFGPPMSGPRPSNCGIERPLALCKTMFFLYSFSWTKECRQESTESPSSSTKVGMLGLVTNLFGLNLFES